MIGLTVPITGRLLFVGIGVHSSPCDHGSVILTF